MTFMPRKTMEPATLKTVQRVPSGKPKRGFANMDAERLREVAAKGGKAAHTAGTCHEFTPEEDREAAYKRHQGRKRK